MSASGFDSEAKDRSVRDNVPVTRILDNITALLGDHLLRTLNDFQNMDLALGYFNFRGWRFFDSRVRAKARGDRPTARILIGMTTLGPQEETLNELQASVDGAPRPEADGETARQRKAELVEQLRSQLMRGMPTPQDRQTLQSLRASLADGTVGVRVSPAARCTARHTFFVGRT